MNNLALLYFMCSGGRDHVAKCILSIDRVWMASEPQGLHPPIKHFSTIFGLMLTNTRHPVFLPGSVSDQNKNSSSKWRSLS